jgi:hypothetical protein
MREKCRACAGMMLLPVSAWFVARETTHTPPAELESLPCDCFERPSNQPACRPGRRRQPGRILPLFFSNHYVRQAFFCWLACGRPGRQ